MLDKIHLWDLYNIAAEQLTYIIYILCSLVLKQYSKSDIWNMKGREELYIACSGCSFLPPDFYPC